MKIKTFFKWFFLVLLLTTLSSCLSATKHLSPHQQYAKKRVSATFEALKEEDYETALKHFAPKGKVNVDGLKKILQDAEISQVDDFEIVVIDVYDHKMEDGPWIAVYVKINNQGYPRVFFVRHNKLILYLGASPHQWYGRKRVSAMFEALKNDDYETAWKYWDLQGEWSVKRFKEFLQHGNISKVDNFEIVWIDIYDFKREDDPWITVYVKINKQDRPLALLIQYDELIFYAAHSIYE